MRYIGCKNKLLDFLDKKISSYCGGLEGKVFCDLFAGTGSVGDRFQDRCKIIANDNLNFSYAINKAKLNNPNKMFNDLGFNPFEYFNNCDCSNFNKGFCFNNFAPQISGRMYFSDNNAKRIDFIRLKIEEWFKAKKINADERDYLIGCLIESLSKVSNVAGVYAAFLRIWDSRALKEMKYIDVERMNVPKFKNEVFNSDANALISKIKGDILYLDPPYTSTQYISQYHVLETIAKNDNPPLHGVGAHRTNGNQISPWSKKYLIAFELEKILYEADFDYIVMSYSDAGLISKNDIEAIFKRYALPGSYKFEEFKFIKYKNTRAVNKEVKENTSDKIHYEYLFFIKKNKNIKFSSPLNYIGGKGDVLNFLLPHFPKKIDRFFDLFGGGANVIINSCASSYVYNDINNFVVELLEFIKKTDIEHILKYIDKRIKEFNLTKGNKVSYSKLRAEYNKIDSKDRNPLDLYLLICFGFEHQIRFNSKFEFNNPCGNSGYNSEMMEKLLSFKLRTVKIGLEFHNKNYKEFMSNIKNGDFVYCDPPYLLTCGAYNDGKRGFNGWDERQQEELFNFLNNLDNKNIKFALSYIEERDGAANKKLLDWVKTNSYKIFKNNKVTKRNRQDRIEILVTNY